MLWNVQQVQYQETRYNKIISYCTFSLSLCFSLCLSPLLNTIKTRNICCACALCSSNICWSHINGRVSTNTHKIQELFYLFFILFIYFLHLITDLLHEDFSPLIRINGRPSWSVYSDYWEKFLRNKSLNTFVYLF